MSGISILYCLAYSCTGCINTTPLMRSSPCSEESILTPWMEFPSFDHFILGIGTPIAVHNALPVLPIGTCKSVNKIKLYNEQAK